MDNVSPYCSCGFVARVSGKHGKVFSPKGDVNIFFYFINLFLAKISARSRHSYLCLHASWRLLCLGSLGKSYLLFVVLADLVLAHSRLRGYEATRLQWIFWLQTGASCRDLDDTTHAVWTHALLCYVSLLVLFWFF